MRFYQTDIYQEQFDIMQHLYKRYPLSERVSNISVQLSCDNCIVMSERIARGYELHMLRLSLQKYGLSEEEIQENVSNISKEYQIIIDEFEGLVELASENKLSLKAVIESVNYVLFTYGTTTFRKSLSVNSRILGFGLSLTPDELRKWISYASYKE